MKKGKDIMKLKVHFSINRIYTLLKRKKNPLLNKCHTQRLFAFLE